MILLFKMEWILTVLQSLKKMLDLYNRIMDEENKIKRSGVKKSMRNRCVKTGSKHFDKETLNQLLIDSGWEGLKEKENLFF